MRFNEQGFSARKCRKIRKICETELWHKINLSQTQFKHHIQTLAMPYGSLLNGTTCNEHHVPVQFFCGLQCTDVTGGLYT